MRRLCADRHSTEARRLYEALARVAHARSDDETAVARALLELMAGGVAAFRGSTLAELVDLVHAAVDRARREPSPTPAALPSAVLSALDDALQIGAPHRPRGPTSLRLRAIRAALEAPEAKTVRRATSSRV